MPVCIRWNGVKGGFPGGSRSPRWPKGGGARLGLLRPSNNQTCDLGPDPIGGTQPPREVGDTLVVVSPVQYSPTYLRVENLVESAVSLKCTSSANLLFPQLESLPDRSQ